MYDLVIRSGAIHDGTGAASRVGDVAVTGQTITAVDVVDESMIGPDTEIIDAQGLIVTPGFVDAHTHYDGQITW
ncbi:MAG: amidohydrolase family protein, partial [Acidimicrobiales bacterium]